MSCTVSAFSYRQFLSTVKYQSPPLVTVTNIYPTAANVNNVICERFLTVTNPKESLANVGYMLLTVMTAGSTFTAILNSYSAVYIHCPVILSCARLILSLLGPVLNTKAPHLTYSSLFYICIYEISHEYE